MQISWGRGFLRGWGVLSLLWILFIGWNEYPPNGFSALFTTSSWRFDDNCWKQIAKWPDGKSFEWFDTFPEYGTTHEYGHPSDVEIKKENHAWTADSIPDRNRWVDAIRHKLKDCEVKIPILEQIELNLSYNWIALKKTILLILMPPLVLFIAGLFFVWILKGFRARA